MNSKAPAQRKINLHAISTPLAQWGSLGEAAFTKLAASVTSSGSGTNHSSPQHSESHLDLEQGTFTTAHNTD